MAIARKQIVHPEQCQDYHIIGRCVRRAFLCGVDRDTGRNYEHRRAWVIERLETLTRAFSIDVAGYAIMSNHYRAPRGALFPYRLRCRDGPATAGL